MAVVCPTITATDPHEYRTQLERIASFAKRVHIDLADGVFAPVKLMDPKQLWWPEGLQVDIHCMYESVKAYTDQLIQLQPDMVILHAESVGSFYEIAQPFKQKGIKVGVALLQETSINTIAPALQDIDHVLIFSGDLGHFGGHANLALLQKVLQITHLQPSIEIGWDGGISVENARKLVVGGVDVLNVGGGIQQVSDPQKAYATLVAAIKK